MGSCVGAKGEKRKKKRNKKNPERESPNSVENVVSSLEANHTRNTHIIRYSLNQVSYRQLHCPDCEKSLRRPPHNKTTSSSNTQVISQHNTQFQTKEREKYNLNRKQRERERDELKYKERRNANPITR